MTTTIAITDTLTLDVGADHVSIERQDGGLVRVEAQEIAKLVAALADAAGRIAAGAAERAR
jgi:hypothetical protein